MQGKNSFVRIFRRPVFPTTGFTNDVVREQDETSVIHRAPTITIL
jgi:hypothetical protein